MAYSFSKAEDEIEPGPACNAFSRSSQYKQLMREFQEGLIQKDISWDQVYTKSSLLSSLLLSCHTEELTLQGRAILELRIT